MRWFVFSVWEPNSSPSYWLAVLRPPTGLGFSDKKLLTQKLPHHDFSSQPNPWSFPLMASPDPAHPPAGRADMSSAEAAGLRQNSPDLYLLCFCFWPQRRKLQGRGSPHSLRSTQKKENVTSAWDLPGEWVRSTRSFSGAKGKAGRQEETELLQLLSRQLGPIGTSLWCGAHPGSCVNAPRQHCSMLAALSPGGEIMILYIETCASGRKGQKTLHFFFLLLVVLFCF